jgi:protein-S-isoprenylcysteine O-methyltransferase Ste14
VRNALALATLVTAQAGRAKLEERTLVRAFPEYADYRRRTPMLLPRPGAAMRAAAGLTTAGVR